MRLLLASALFLAACGGREEAAPLDEEWKRAVALSRPRVAPATADPLAHALEVVWPQREALRRLVDDAIVSEQPPALSPEVAAAVEALEAWHQAGGGLARRTCAEQVEGGRRVLAAVTLADLALHGAPEDRRAARLDAVLYLAHRLREEGANLLDVTAGSEIADNAIKWAESRGLAPTAAARQLAPRDDLLSRAVAAEAQCSLELARQPGDTVLPRSELDAVRRFYLSALRAIDEGGGDQAVAARLGALADEAHADRRHPVLGVVVPALGRIAGSLLEQRRRYHAFVGGIR